MFETCVWHNEPRRWSLANNVLTVQTDRATDFWRETHYGFTRDSGHFYGVVTGGDFTAEVRVRGRYETLYDQAGIMVRIDETNWVKAGLELSDGKALLSSVLTMGRSDWATGTYTHDPADFRMRATVKSGVLRIQVSSDGKSWPLVRLAPFPSSASYSVGPVCCTPERQGLVVEFSEFVVSPPSGKDLHDLS
jgi:uncharacterized protein